MMTADQYLRNILAREWVDTGALSPLRGAAARLTPMLQHWGNRYLLAVEPSGSFAKGTCNSSSADIDVLLSLSSNTPGTLADIRSTLINCLRQNGYNPTEQNVSLGVKVSGFKVDLVPGRRQSQHGFDHSLYRRKTNGWTKTNIRTHVALVRNSGRTEEIRILKLWRDQKRLDFPSIYLELATLEALRGRPLGNISSNVAHALRFFRDRLALARIVDPANTKNVISDDLSASEKRAVGLAANTALLGQWTGVVV